MKFSLQSVCENSLSTTLLVLALNAFPAGAGFGGVEDDQCQNQKQMAAVIKLSVIYFFAQGQRKQGERE